LVSGGAIVALLSACVGASPAPAKPSATTDASASEPAEERAAPGVGKGTLTGTFWFDQPTQWEAFQQLVQRFHSSQSRVRMEVVLVPGPEIPAKLATAIAGGEPPDAVRMGGAATNALFINNGHAAVLDDWDPKIGTYDWLPGAQKAVTRNGKMHAMPVNSGVLALFYNKDLYKHAGLDPETPPATLDQLLETAARISASGDRVWGHYMLTAPNSQTGLGYFPTILWAFGGKEVSDDGKTITFNTAEGVAALQWYKDLIDGRGMPIKSVNETQMVTDYLTGAVGSMAQFPAAVARVAAANFKSASAKLPAGPKGGVAPLGFGTIMVLDKARNRDAGWEFARFVGLEASNAVAWNVGFGQLPPRLSFREDPRWKEYAANNPLIPAFVEAQKSTDVSYFGPGAQEIGTELGKAIEAVVFSQKTPTQAIDDAARASQTILDRERQKGG
jgi:multiple sugar transport system substrate-binding protein